ncbi:MAG: hypothetical protein ACXV2C_06610 [Candidatus Bathyarchaeia archaeon]
MLGYLVFVAAFGSMLATFVYVRSMFKGETKPNRVTWFMWSIAPFVATTAAVSNGVGLAVIPVFMSGFSPFLVFTASFLNKKAYWKLTLFDYLCGILSGLAVVLWFLTNNPNLAIIFAIIGDALAAIPTQTKAWHNPETESAWPFIVGVFSPMTSFLVATTWGFSELAFPIYLIVINILLVFSVSKKKW